MSNITKVAGGMPALPEDFAAKLSAGIAESRATTIVGAGGKPFLRLLKSGEWVYGAENIDVQDGSQWAVNPVTLMHGYACWVDSELRGEIMVSMTEPKPIRPGPIDGTPYKEQRSFELRCVNGDDEGTEVLFKTTSYGGMKMCDGFLGEIRDHLMSGFPCPIVTLDSEHYEHKKFGRIYNPLMAVAGWCDMNGNLQVPVYAAVDHQVEASPAPVAPPARQRRAAAAPAAPPATKATIDVAVPAAPVGAPTPVGAPAPVSTTQAHTGQRRRPAAR